MNTKRIGKLATVAASAALTLQLFAGASLAAQPNASATGSTFGQFGGGGYAGFTTTFRYRDSSTASKIFMEAKVTGGASIVPSLLTATRGTKDVSSSCFVQASPLAVECSFKTVRNPEDITVTFAVVPAAGANAVTTQPAWSTTGFGSGAGDNSHGDDWKTAVLTSSRNPSDDFAAGFGNTTLTTLASSNQQLAKLAGLPAGKYASVNDAGAGVYFGFNEIDISVNNGAAATFELIITYPKGTSAPKGYLHVSTGWPTVTYTQCARGDTSECFAWDNKSNTATIYLAHNGSLRRTS